jgi:hypothetical protein
MSHFNVYYVDVYVFGYRHLFLQDHFHEEEKKQALPISVDRTE